MQNARVSTPNRIVIVGGGSGGISVAASLLGFVMPSSVGRAVVMVPIGMALADRVGFRPGSNGRIGVAAALAAGTVEGEAVGEDVPVGVAGGRLVPDTCFVQF